MAFFHFGQAPSHPGFALCRDIWQLWVCFLLFILLLATVKTQSLELAVNLDSGGALFGPVLDR